MNNARSEIKKVYELDIAELQRAIRDRQAKAVEDCITSDQDFFPANVFVEIPKPELNRGSWAEYTRVALELGGAPAPLNDVTLREAIDVYGPLITQRYLVAFLQQPENSEGLAHYIRSRIGGFEEVRDERAASHFCLLLEAMGYHQPAATAFNPAQPPIVQHPDWENVPDEQAFFDTFDADAGVGAVAVQATYLAPNEADNITQRGAGGVQYQHAAGPSTRGRSGPNTRSRSTGDPRGKKPMGGRRA